MVSKDVIGVLLKNIDTEVVFSILRLLILNRNHYKLKQAQPY